MDDYIAVGASWVVTKLLVKSELPDLLREILLAKRILQPATEPTTSRVKYSTKMRYESRRCIHLVKTGPRASFPRYATYTCMELCSSCEIHTLLAILLLIDAGHTALNNNFLQFKFISFKFMLLWSLWYLGWFDGTFLI